MDRIQVSAGKTLLESYVKTPPVGVCELIWNAFDEDATNVRVQLVRDALGGIERIDVTDDGNGMNLERATMAFSAVGDSWKMPKGITSDSGRPVHGRFGRGRYAAFSLGQKVEWNSTSKAVEGAELRTTRVVGSRAQLAQFDIEEARANGDSSTGTAVSITNVSDEALKSFDHPEQMRNRLLAEFALHLDRYEDFSITLLGSALDPASAIEDKAEIELVLAASVEGSARLVVIEWRLQDVERRMYLCTEDGTVVDEVAAGIHAVGAEFTAYVEWSGFSRDQAVLMEGDEDSPGGQVLIAARDALRKHMAESSRRRESRTIASWRREGVYPYEGEPGSAVERATRDTFNLVAMASARTINDAKSTTTKGLALRLLRETFEGNPESLLPILRNFSQLPSSRIDELRDILEHTTLAGLIAAGHEVGGRIRFLDGLSSLLFDRLTRKTLLERRQLHRILAHETWIFGESWSLTGDDVNLDAVLRKFLVSLGEDVELADLRKVEIVDGSDAIPDLVLGRQLETQEDHLSQLVIELKRPNHRLSDEDVSQIRRYASSIVNDERFARPNVTWEFWLVGNAVQDVVDEARRQVNMPFGYVHNGERYKIIVKTWSEVIGDARHRLKFVQKSLQYESDRDSGLAYMREKYAKYLPPLTKDAADGAADDGAADGAADDGAADGAADDGAADGAADDGAADDGAADGAADDGAADDGAADGAADDGAADDGAADDGAADELA